MTSIVIIPARYDSTRFPGKPLSLLRGKTLIQHVYDNSKGAQLINDIIVATDSEMIFEKVLSFGGKVVMTDGRHNSGTDRIAEVAESMDCDIVVNVQADEPLIRPEMIDDVISLLDDKRASIGTLVKRITDPNEISDPNVVKVVFDKDGFALYFSRSPIPYLIDEWGSLYDLIKIKNTHDSSLVTRHSWFKHIGIYSYRREALLSFSKMEQTELEIKERLEQLRALENGMKIKVKETFYETIGVDTPEDLERVERCLNISL
ncbi:MAG: 3-deoxy-manno-octulosonate cytidylyltransferase [Thermodesulfovibrionales bacterium]